MTIQTKFGELEVNRESKIEITNKTDLFFYFVATCYSEIYELRKMLGLEDDKFLGGNSMYVVCEIGKAHFIKYFGDESAEHNPYRNHIYNQFVTICRLNNKKCQKIEFPVYMVSINMDENALELSIRF